MDNPRKLALLSLIKSDTQECFTNIEINTVLSRASLDSSDAALYTLLYMGVIEKKLFLDNIISQYSKTSIDKIDVETKNAIRLALYQLVFTDRIPDYSAVDESVNLSPKKSKGFVNAILRNFLRNEKRVSYPSDRFERLSCEYSIPMDIINILRESYGDETAEKICSYDEKDRSLSLRVNTLKTNADEIKNYLLSKGYEPSISKYSKDIIKCSVSIKEITDLIDTGYVFIQDESSRICTVAVDAKAGERVADVCACPGGKTFSMGIDMKNSGEIKSSDLHKNKIGLIEKGSKKLGIDIVTASVQNAKEYKEEYKRYFDKVLCDVPCSGLGVIFKKPEIKYKSIENIRALPDVQYAILKNCCEYVKVGGYLIYSTCTVCKNENENNVTRFLAENSDFVPVEFCVGDITSRDGMYTFLPHITGTDGFFVAKMKRVK